MKNKTFKPLMFRNHPFFFIFTLFLCLTGIGFLIFAIWWLKCYSHRLNVKEYSIELETGILSKHENEIAYSDIKNIVVRQSFIQRIFGVGYIGISSAGQDEIEIEIYGIENPSELKDFIYSQRNI
ncbi:MAG: PH domain-containing protein [Opitutales bacterium]|nr:PH domain-containing protein [Opitutales bacterium]